MLMTPQHLLQQIIQPTLDYLGVDCDNAAFDLLQTLQQRGDVGLFAAQNGGLGLYQITAAQHRDLWDRYLAYHPDIASRVRGLASQRAFLSNPERELQTNLGYSTAIAWLLLKRARHELDTDHAFAGSRYAPPPVPITA